MGSVSQDLGKLRASENAGESRLACTGRTAQVLPCATTGRERHLQGLQTRWRLAQGLQSLQFIPTTGDLP